MSKKRTFFLKGFNIQDTEKKFGIFIISNIEKESIIPKNKTDIFDLIEKNEDVPISFLDEKNDKCLVTMLDWIKSV